MHRLSGRAGARSRAEQGERATQKADRQDTAARARAAVKTSKSFSIPAPIFEEALRQSRLDRAVFKQALMGEGADDVRCTTQIVLIEAATASGSADAIVMLQNMFG
jgi:hypothetical protein